MNRRSWLSAGMAVVMLGGVGMGRAAAAGEIGLRFGVERIDLGMNEERRVTMVMDAEEIEVVGVDAVVRFDAQKIHIVGAGGSGELGNETGAKIDNEAGRARISWSNGYGVYTRGSKEVGWVQVKRVGEGETNLSWEFTPGNTADTNVVAKGGGDKLEKTTGLVVGGGERGSGGTSETSGGEVLGVEGKTESQGLTAEGMRKENEETNWEGEEVKNVVLVGKETAKAVLGAVNQSVRQTPAEGWGIGGGMALLAVGGWLWRRSEDKVGA